MLEFCFAISFLFSEIIVAMSQMHAGVDQAKRRDANTLTNIRIFFVLSLVPIALRNSRPSIRIFTLDLLLAHLR
jgi:hypothetical protein